MVAIVLATAAIFVRGLVALADHGSPGWTLPLAIGALVGWLWLAGEVSTKNAAIDRELQWTKEALDDARRGIGSRPVPSTFRELSQRWDRGHEG